MYAALLMHYAYITVRYSVVEHERIIHRTTIVSLILSKRHGTSATTAELITV